MTLTEPYNQDNLSPDEIVATEILTTGLELMAKDPLKLILKDREFFEFLWEIITNA